MKKNDSIELKIEDMGVDGEGIGKYEGMTFLEPSPYRVKPECPLYARCGGCQIQAMDYRQQLCYKQKKVRGNLIRIGGFAPELIDSVMEEIVGMEQPYRYRNKAQFPIGADRDGMLVAGFYAARTHSIIPVEDCKLGVTQNEQILGTVLSYMRENEVRPYDETTGKGLVRHVLIRYGFTSKELMVCLVINGETLPQEKKLVDVLRKIEGMTSISVNINRKNTNVILGEETRTNRLSHFPAVFLPGKPGADGEVVQSGTFLRGSDWQGDRLGSILWNRDDLAVSGTEGGEGLRRGDRAAGNRRR